MPEVRIEYTNHAVRDLRKLEKVQARRIVAKIQQNVVTGAPLKRAKPLTGELAGLYRYRVGTYRIIFSIHSTEAVCVLSVLTVRHRKDVYN